MGHCVVILYALAKLRSLNETYTLLGNLFPEIAGLMVVGRYILEWMIMPYQRICYETSMISRLYRVYGDRNGASLSQQIIEEEEE